MSAKTIKDEDYISFEFDIDTGVSSDGIWLCIAQLPSRTKSEIEADSPCQKNIDALSELLAAGDGGPLLTQNAQPGQLPLVVCPEYSFGSADWVRIDALVEAYVGPLVLVAGFGQCSLAGLNSIRESAVTRSVTLSCGWRDEPPHGGRSMNFGSVWVKKADQSRNVVLFGKNFLEAKNEDLKGVFKFAQLTEVAFNDVRILPFICADAIETPKPGSRATVGQRLAQRVISHHKPAICIGSLLQPEKQASEQWVNAIDRLIHEFGEANVVLVISNIATGSFDSRTGGDQWRNLSGVYVSKRKQVKGQKRAQESTDYFESASLMAWPLRSNLPQVAFGTISVPPYSAASGVLHPWNAPPTRPRCLISTGEGGRIQEYVRSGLQDELLLLAEVTRLHCSGADLKFEHVKTHIEGESREAATNLVSQLLDGPLSPQIKRQSVSDLCHQSRVALAQCLACLDAVKEGSRQVVSVDEKFSWASTPLFGEVIRLGTFPIPVAMWWSVSSSMGESLAELRERALSRGPCATLRVFGKGTDGDFDPDLWREICRDTTCAGEEVAPGAQAESQLEYGDLSTVGATSIQHLLKLRGFQPLMNLARTRCEKKDKFVQGYNRLIQSVLS